MIRKTVSYLFLGFVGGILAIIGLAALTAHGAVLHAATVVADPVVAIASAADTGWDVFTTDGPLWGGLLIAAGLLRTFLNRQHWLAQGKVLSGLTGLSLVVAAVLAWHFADAPASGILTALFAGYTLITHSQVPGATPKPSSPTAGAGTAAMLAVLLLGAGMVGNAACANPEMRAKEAGSAALGCGLPIAVSLGQQLKPMFLEALAGAVSGDGLHWDKAKLKAIAAPLATPALRCAFDAAIAFLLAPTPAQPGAPQSAPFVIDPGALGSTWLAVRQDLAWGSQ